MDLPNENNLRDPSLDSVEIVNSFLREDPDPTTGILENVNGIRKELGSAIEHENTPVYSVFIGEGQYKQLLDGILEYNHEDSNSNLGSHIGITSSVVEGYVLAEAGIYNPNDRNEYLKNGLQNASMDLSIGLLLFIENKQISNNQKILYIPNPAELIKTLQSEDSRRRFA